MAADRAFGAVAVAVATAFALACVAVVGLVCALAASALAAVRRRLRPPPATAAAAAAAAARACPHQHQHQQPARSPVRSPARSPPPAPAPARDTKTLLTLLHAAAADTPPPPATEQGVMEEAEAGPAAVLRRLRRLVAEFTAAERQQAAQPPWGHLLAVGDAYHRGAFPHFRPDPLQAERLYRLAARAPDAEVSGLGQARFIDARLNPMAAEDVAGARLPDGPGLADDLCASAERALASAPSDAYLARPRFPGATVDAPTNAPPGGPWGPPPPLAPGAVRRLWQDVEGVRLDNDGWDQDALLQEALLEDARARQRARHPRHPPPAPARAEDGQRAGYDKARADPQNVHDSAINAATRTNLERLQAQDEQRRRQQEQEQGRRPVATWADVPSLLRAHGGVDAATLARAQRAVAGLSDAAHSAYGLSERDALGLVLRRVLALDDATLQANLVGTLAHQLSDGLSVCSTGKVARMVSVLDGVEQGGVPVLEAARPMWAVREELGSLAARVRDADPDADADTLRARFEQEARAEYVDRLGMQWQVLAPVVDTLAQGF